MPTDYQEEVIMKRKKAPQFNTFRKLQDLGFQREQFMKQHGEPPFFYATCKKLVIDPRALKRNALELFLNWYEINFH
jgi:hypothetical protein